MFIGEFYLLMNILVILRGVCLPVDNDDLDREAEHLFEGFAEGVKVFVCDEEVVCLLVVVVLSFFWRGVSVHSFRGVLSFRGILLLVDTH